MRTTAKITNNIQRKVIADQLSARYASMIIDEVMQLFKEFNGTKIVKVDGSYTKKFNDRLKAIFPTRTANITRVSEEEGTIIAKPHNFRLDLAHKSLYIKANIAVSFGKSLNDADDFIYNDFNVYVGAINDNNELVYDEEIFKKAMKYIHETIAIDYEEIKAKRLELIELARRAEAIKQTMPYYARKVNHYDTV